MLLIQAFAADLSISGYFSRQSEGAEMQMCQALVPLAAGQIIAPATVVRPDRATAAYVKENH